jgi:hypothetical protein
MLPTQRPPLIQAISLVAQPTAQTQHSYEVGHDEGRGRALGQVLEVRGEPVVGLAGGLLGLLLGQIGLGARPVLDLLGFLLETLGLRLGLDFLLAEVRGDRVYRGCVDVDERGGGGFYVRDGDGGGLGGGGLGNVLVGVLMWCLKRCLRAKGSCVAGELFGVLKSSR